MSMSDVPKPRAHHHFFCHVMLPRLAFSNPKRFVDTFGVPAGIDYLRDLWNGVGQQQFAAEAVPHTGLALHQRTLRTGAFAIVVEAPQPAGVTESYFVAAPFASREAPELDRLYSLELSFYPDRDHPFAVICGWTGDSRFNTGRRTEPTLAAFVEALEQLESPS